MDGPTADGTTGQLRPELLTSGVRNDAYYLAVADALASYIPPLF